MLDKLSPWLKIILIIPIAVIFIASLSFTILNYPAAKAITKTEIRVRPLADSEVARIVSTSIVQNNLNRERAAEILESTVRIKRGDSAGTGVIIASYEHPLKKIHFTYIITNRHNVSTAETVTVESFNYLQRREIASVTSYIGKIVKRSRSPDLALIELRTEKAFGRPATFINMGELEQVALYDPVFVCGCSLGLPPFITNGNLAGVQKDIYLITAFAIFGNSGGGLFDINGRLLGIVTKIAGVPVQNGEGTVNVPVPNMPYVIPSTVAANWLSGSDYSFIIGEGSFADYIVTKEENLSQQFHDK